MTWRLKSRTSVGERFQVPVAAVESVEIRSAGAVAILRLLEARAAPPTATSAGEAPARFQEMALRPRAHEVDMLMAAIRWWLPEVRVRIRAPQPPPKDAHELAA